MSSLESAAIPLLMPMIQGHARRVLTMRDRGVIGTWAVKTAMVVEFMNEPQKRYFTQEERIALKNDPTSIRDLGAYVWLGRFTDTNEGITGSHAYGTLEDRAPYAHVILERFLETGAQRGPYQEL